MKTNTPLTDGTWKHSKRNAEYCHGTDNKDGTDNKAAIWQDIACDMRDLCRKLEQDREELLNRTQ